jgi:uncharacterized membrane protein
MSTPTWALSLAYWLHMLATVVWVGGLAALAGLVLPAARQSLDAQTYADLLGRIQKRLDPLGWFSLLLLVGTGLVQMSASPNYTGFLEIGNRWAAAILAKHLVIAGMVGVSAYLTWGVMPGLKRAALRAAQGKTAPEAERLQRQEDRLLRLNLALAMIVLALTAVARAS